MFEDQFFLWQAIIERVLAHSDARSAPLRV
jgi:hypothetical protein